MSVTGDERNADQKARPEMTILSILLSTLARIEAALSSMDRAIPRSATAPGAATATGAG
jgi:hypothetical protein